MNNKKSCDTLYRPMNMNKYFFPLVCLLITNYLFAQYSSITGKITDEKAQPLPYITLQLTTPDTAFIQGTTTDEQGNYKLTEVGPGNYLLFLSSIGYEQKTYPFRQENKDRALPDIILKSSSIALKEVEVKAQSFVRLEDRMMVFPEKQQVRHAYTGYDLLDNLMIPGVNVDRHEGKVTTFAGEVTLYINGRQADYQEVKNLRPRDIEKVEYFDVPTGKYAMDVASINYITKKYDTGGYVSADAKQTIGYLNGDYNAAAKVSHKNTSFTVWSGHRMQSYEGTRSIADETYIFPEYEINKHSETLDGLSRTNRQYVYANVEHRTDRRTLLAKAGFTRNATPEEWQELRTLYTGQYNREGYAYNTQNQTAISPNLNLYGNFKIKDNQTLEANISGSYSNTLYERSYDEIDFHSFTQANENFYHFFGSLNYVLQLQKQQSLTIHIFQNYALNTTNYIGDYNQGTLYWLDQSFLFCEYMMLPAQKVSMNISAGLLWEIYHLRDAKMEHHPSPMGSLRLTYQPTNNHKVLLYSGIQQILPSFQWMNPIEQKVDSFMVKRGNPNQDWSIYWNNRLSYNMQIGKINLSAMAGLVLSTIPFSSYLAESNKIVNTYDNGNTTTQTTLEIGLTWKPVQNLHVKANGIYAFQQGKGALSYKHNVWQGSAQIKYYWKSLGISTFFKSPLHIMDEGATHDLVSLNYGLTVNWSHKGWWLEAGTNAPFSKDLMRKSYLDAFPTVYSYYKTIHDRTYQQIGWVKVAYTFDFGRKTARTRTDAGADIQSTILKAE